jgi:hypothetical protein
MTNYSNKNYRKTKEEREEEDPTVIGDEYNDGSYAYEINEDEDKPIQPNPSITQGEADGNREVLVAEEVDPYEDYYKKPKPNIPSVFDTFKGTVRITSETISGGDGKTLYSYRDRSDYHNNNSSGITGNSKGNSPKPGHVFKGSSTDFSKFYKRNIADLKRRGKIK